MRTSNYNPNDPLVRRQRLSRRKSEARNVHACGACLAEFKTKRECWWHMDHACPKRPNAKLTGAQSKPKA